MLVGSIDVNDMTVCELDFQFFDLLMRCLFKTFYAYNLVFTALSDYKSINKRPRGRSLVEIHTKKVYVTPRRAFGRDAAFQG